MSAVLSRFGLPLLTRELIQQSARRRTYVVRVLYASVLYVVAYWHYQRLFTSLGGHTFEVLGQGRTLFELIVRWQLWGIYLFVPLTTCGVITSEKERQTLDLLRLTRIGGWSILIQKLLSRLMEIGTFLLLPAPLLAMAYGLGGVETQDLTDAAIGLSLVALQVGAFSLMCSACFRTTVGAIAGVYVLGLLASWLEPWIVGIGLLCVRKLGWTHELVAMLYDFQGTGLLTPVRMEIHPFHGNWVLGLSDVDSLMDIDIGPPMLAIDPPKASDIYVGDDDSSVSGTALTFLAPMGSPTTNAIVRGMPMLLSSLIFLVMARVLIWRRSHPGSSRIKQSVLACVDRLLRISVNPFARPGTPGSAVNLPVDRPIAWYERRQRLVGDRFQLTRMLLLIELPLAAWLTHASAISPVRLELIWGSLWALELLMVISISTSLIPSIRSRQTLDVLLVSPLQEREIVLQKMAGLKTLMALFCIPLLTVLAFRVFDLLPAAIHSNRRLVALELLVVRRIAATALYLPLVAWLGFQLGTRLKNPFRAAIALVLLLVGVCGIPRFVGWMMIVGDPIGATDVVVSTGVVAWLVQLDPVSTVFGIELQESSGRAIALHSDNYLYGAWLACVFHFLVVGGMLWAVRRNALNSFSRLVGRLEPGSVWQSKMSVPDTFPQLASIAPGLPDDNAGLSDIKDGADAKSDLTRFVSRQK